MYRVVLGPRKILGMADPVNVIYGRMTEKASKLMEHIGKCVIWGKHYHSYDHWIHEEISVYINEFARKKPKSSFKLSLIKANLFNQVGTEYYDAWMNLLDIYEESQMEKDPYPEVDVTEEMGEAFFHAYYEIRDKISHYLLTHKYREFPKGQRPDYRDEIDPIIYSVLDEYC